MEVVARVAGQGRHLVVFAEVKQTDAALEVLIESLPVNYARQSVQSNAHCASSALAIPVRVVVVLDGCVSLLLLLIHMHAS